MVHAVSELSEVVEWTHGPGWRSRRRAGVDWKMQTGIGEATPRRWMQSSGGAAKWERKPITTDGKAEDRSFKLISSMYMAASVGLREGSLSHKRGRGRERERDWRLTEGVSVSSLISFQSRVWMSNFDAACRKCKGSSDEGTPWQYQRRSWSALHERDYWTWRCSLCSGRRRCSGDARHAECAGRAEETQRSRSQPSM